MSEQNDSLVGQTVADRYEILREIGQGAMGTVYEARHTLIGRRFAIKVLHRRSHKAKLGERFFHEARAAGALSHQHIVQVQDFGLTTSGEPFLAMEFIDGISLESYMETNGALPWPDVVEICAQVLSALEVIHGAGLVHRDVKPANIMILRGRKPRLFAKLLDFGIARAINPSWHRPDLTRVNQILGTPAYLSPEQIDGGQADPRCDLWATAVIIYECLSGSLPVAVENVEQIINDLGKRRLISLRERNVIVPEWLLEITDRALHPRIDMRFQTASTFLQALEHMRVQPEGEENSEARTTPFLRVDLDEPPEELLSQLAQLHKKDKQASNRDKSSEQANLRDTDQDAAKEFTVEIEPQRSTRRDEPTIPMKRSASTKQTNKKERKDKTSTPKIAPQKTTEVPPEKTFRLWLLVNALLVLLLLLAVLLYLVFIRQP